MATAKKATFLDKRFAAFAAEIMAAMKNGTNAVFFCGKNVNFEADPTDLKALMEIKIGEDKFSLTDNLENKAKLAALGYLGQELIQMGQRCLQAVEERKRRDVVRASYDRLKALWGPYTRKVWGMHVPCARSEKVAASARQILDLIKGGQQMPQTIRAARQAGCALQFLSTAEWADIKKLVVALTTLKKQQKA